MRLLAVLFLFLLPFASALAQSDIHRCVGKDGNTVFTDRVCSDVNAAPYVPPAAASTASAATASPVTLAPPPILCATDIKQLKQAVAEAFANRDPNRLAGLMLWEGDGRDAVVASIRRFTRLMQRPLLDITAGPAAASSVAPPADPNLFDAPPPEVSSSIAHGASPGLVVQTAADDGSGTAQSTHFDIVHRSGCLWLAPD
jgi:hypothetical protein